MGIKSESTTYIEQLLKNALEKEKIPFIEQYLVYTGGKFSDVKYVGDFFIEKNNIRLIVECDGFTFHAGADRRKKQQERDSWLKQKGYKVINFTTNQIKYRRKLNYSDLLCVTYRP